MGSLNIFKLNDIINKYNLKIFVETGTGEGDSLFYAAKHSFDHCYSIELNDQLFKKTSKIFNSDYISVLNGSSSQELKKLIRQISNDPVLFFLHADFPSGSDFGLDAYTDVEMAKDNIPMIEELELIHKFRARKNDVIIMDDLRLFKEYPPNPLPKEIKRLSGIFEACASYFKKSHEFLEVQQDDGYLVLLPKLKTKSETSKVRHLILPYIEDAEKIADIGFGGDKIISNAVGIDYEIPYTYTGDDHVDIGCDVLKGIPVVDHEFDCVYSSHLIEDFEDTRSILKEFIRILKPNGILALVVPNEVTYREHCLKTNQQYNGHHKIKHMDANYLESTLKSMSINLEVLYKENLIIDYNSILIVKLIS
jgi:predicted SAM-dependent methyltransferase